MNFLSLRVAGLGRYQTCLIGFRLGDGSRRASGQLALFISPQSARRRLLCVSSNPPHAPPMKTNTISAIDPVVDRAAMTSHDSGKRRHRQPAMRSHMVSQTLAHSSHEIDLRQFRQFHQQLSFAPSPLLLILVPGHRLRLYPLGSQPSGADENAIRIRGQPRRVTLERQHVDRDAAIVNASARANHSASGLGSHGVATASSAVTNVTATPLAAHR